MLPKRLVFVDVGAYLGEVSRSYQAFLNAEPERFYLIEPNPVSFAKLQETMPKSHLYNIAIDDHDGTETLYYDERYYNASSLYAEMAAGKGGEVKEVETPVCTMDNFMAVADIEHIDFLKVNCEGGEFGMFGAPSLNFLDHTTYLLISFHGKREVFTNEKATAKKLEINSMLLNSGFRWLDGVRPEVLGKQGGRSHEMQFWKKD